MKSVWQTKTLGELCAIELGKTPARANAKFWDEKRETNNVWLSIADLLSAEDGIVSDSKEYLSDAGAALCKIVPAGTLMVSFKLTLGRLAYAGRNLYTNEAIAALSIRNEQQLSKEFLFYFLHFFDWQKATDSDVKLKGRTLNKAKLKVMPVHFPNPEEQQRIVGILDEAFAGIATAKANAEKNLQNARALFESHLHAVFSHRGPGWVEKTLDEVCIIGDGNHSSNYPRKEELVDAGVPFIRATNLVEGRISGEDMRFLSPEKHAQLKKGHLRTGDVLFTNRGEIGKTAIVDADYDNANLNSQIAWLRCLNDLHNCFLLHLLNSGEMKRHFEASKNGAALQQFTIRQLKELVIPHPPKSVQQSITARLDALQTETRRLEALYASKLAALDELKAALLHQAFSGQL